jgi:uncharacterized heparinase superfamily protein
MSTRPPLLAQPEPKPIGISRPNVSHSFVEVLLHDSRRLLSTLRHLKAEQLLYRALRRALPPAPVPVETLVPRDWKSAWHAPRWQQVGWDGRQRFEFLGVAGSPQGPGWTVPGSSALWAYHLHYLDALNARNLQNADACRHLIESWIADNPPATGVGWEPYCVSRRVINLVKWCSRERSRAENITSSIATQAEYLSGRLERDIQANHLFANGVALVFAGAFGYSRTSDRWLDIGLTILDEQLPEQFTPDGGHFELSPMYHALLSWDVCDLVNLARRSGLSSLTSRAANWTEVVERALRWLQAMTHPDGLPSFFNDAAFEAAPTLEDLSGYARELSIDTPPAPAAPDLAVEYLRDTGYVACELGDHGKLIVDVGRVGPDYQPGHAHADTLSFELSILGQRCFVNSGTSVYGNSSERSRQRGTAAHNTVVVDGCDSSEVWAGFRVGRRALPLDVSVHRDSNAVTITAAHDGYRYLPGRVIHRRRWVVERRSLTITDELSGRFHSARAYLHMHPDAAIVDHGPDFLRCSLPNGAIVRLDFENARNVQTRPSTWHPAFGRVIGSSQVLADFAVKRLVTRISWEG